MRFSIPASHQYLERAYKVKTFYYTSKENIFFILQKKKKLDEETIKGAACC